MSGTNYLELEGVDKMLLLVQTSGTIIIAVSCVYRPTIRGKIDAYSRMIHDTYTYHTSVPTVDTYNQCRGSFNIVSIRVLQQVKCMPGINYQSGYVY